MLFDIIKDNKSVVVEDKGGGSPISPGSLKASGNESCAGKTRHFAMRIAHFYFKAEHRS